MHKPAILQEAFDLATWQEYQLEMITKRDNGAFKISSNITQTTAGTSRISNITMGNVGKKIVNPVIKKISPIEKGPQLVFQMWGQVWS